MHASVYVFSFMISVVSAKTMKVSVISGKITIGITVQYYLDSTRTTQTVIKYV